MCEKLRHKSKNNSRIIFEFDRKISLFDSHRFTLFGFLSFALLNAQRIRMLRHSVTNSIDVWIVINVSHKISCYYCCIRYQFFKWLERILANGKCISMLRTCVCAWRQWEYEEEDGGLKHVKTITARKSKCDIIWHSMWINSIANITIAPWNSLPNAENMLPKWQYKAVKDPIRNMCVCVCLWQLAICVCYLPNLTHNSVIQ